MDNVYALLYSFFGTIMVCGVMTPFVMLAQGPLKSAKDFFGRVLASIAGYVIGLPCLGVALHFWDLSGKSEDDRSFWFMSAPMLLSAVLMVILLITGLRRSGLKVSEDVA